MNKYQVQRLFRKFVTEQSLLEISSFASMLSHQLKNCFLWKPDPFRLGTGAFQLNWSRKFLYAFPSFSLISRVLKSVLKDLVETIILVALT